MAKRWFKSQHHSGGTVYNRVGAVKAKFHTHEPERYQGRHAKRGVHQRPLTPRRLGGNCPRHEQKSFARPTKARSLYPTMIFYSNSPNCLGEAGRPFKKTADFKPPGSSPSRPGCSLAAPLHQDCAASSTTAPPTSWPRRSTYSKGGALL